MSEEARPQNEELFMILVMNFHQMAMIGMGKLVNPATGKATRDLSQAKFAIDVLEMLANRTGGNLSKTEDSYLQNTLTELRLNYVDETAKPEPAAVGSTEDGPATEGEAEPAADETAASPGEDTTPESSKTTE